MLSTTAHPSSSPSGTQVWSRWRARTALRVAHLIAVVGEGGRSARADQ